MVRKILLCLIAVTAMTVATLPTNAFARGGWSGHGGWHGGWGGHGGWHGGWYGRSWGYGVGLGLGYGLYGYPYRYGYPYSYAAYGYDSYECYRTVRVATTYGWRWQRIWVCN